MNTATKKFWTKSEENNLISDWSRLSMEEMKGKYRRSRSSICHKAKNLKLVNRHIFTAPNINWTKTEETQLADDFPTMNRNELELKYARNYKAIKTKAGRLGIERKKLIQSYDVNVYDLNNTLMFHTNIAATSNSKATLKSVISRIKTKNIRAIDRGEWTLSITHNLECFN